MIRFGRCLVWGGLPALLAVQAAFGAETNAAPDFKEVYDLVRAHVAGLSEAELNRKAVEALVSALAPKVSLAGAGETTGAARETPLISKATLFEGDIAYLRISRVGSGLDKAVHGTYSDLSATNKLKGVVLDLRYADGSDYAAAAATADLFVKDERWLLKWGDNAAHSKAKNDAITLPVAVLVNHETAGAAEALAAVLRDTGSGLVLGARTAGRATVTENFALRSGQELRIATAPVRLGDGSSLPAQGVQPDIAVEVNPQDERAYFADAFSMIGRTNAPALAGLSLTNSGAGTNRAGRRVRFNEAELVRERKEGASADAELANERDNEPEEPMVHDPALVRALDLLKGLAVVRHSRS
jgi:hypothetical protein